MQGKESIMVVRCELKIPSEITVRHHFASLMMWNSYPHDGISICTSQPWKILIFCGLFPERDIFPSHDVPSSKEYARKRIYNGREVPIENSIIRDNCSASLYKPYDVEQLLSRWNFQSAPHNHERFLYSADYFQGEIYSHHTTFDHPISGGAGEVL